MPAFSSCSLTASCICCHWGSLSPNSFTCSASSPATEPSLYFVTLIFTWSPSATSPRTVAGTNRSEKRELTHQPRYNPQSCYTYSHHRKSQLQPIHKQRCHWHHPNLMNYQQINSAVYIYTINHHHQKSPPQLSHKQSSWPSPAITYKNNHNMYLHHSPRATDIAFIT